MPTQLYEKEQILDACFIVFVQYGYTNTSTAMLAEAAGISKALIFHHFKSKKQLYFSVLSRCFEKMEPAVSNIPKSEYKDYFHARAMNGLIKIEYFKKNLDVAKIIFEACYNTPAELKADIGQFIASTEAKYGSMSADKEKWMRELFEEVPIREGIDKEYAYELINSTMHYFNKKYLSEITDEKKLLDEAYWQRFFEKKNKFLDMIRYGIEQKRE